jgi:hypothetical protein
MVILEESKQYLNKKEYLQGTIDVELVQHPYVNDSKDCVKLVPKVSETTGNPYTEYELAVKSKEGNEYVLDRLFRSQLDALFNSFGSDTAQWLTREITLSVSEVKRVDKKGVERTFLNWNIMPATTKEDAL